MIDNNGFVIITLTYNGFILKKCKNNYTQKKNMNNILE
jgi:hypothetical protein